MTIAMRSLWIIAAATAPLCASSYMLTRNALADSPPQVKLDTSRATPRNVEDLTARSILRDYTAAWSNLAQAMESNNLGPIEASFVGTARAQLVNAVREQRKADLSSQYSGQSHNVQAVFYPPEGDVLQLHDTADYEFQLRDGERVVHQEHVTIHYVVLMTPGADRWSVRQLQAVPEF